MFKKFVQELTEATTTTELANVYYRKSDGIDRSYVNGTITEDEFFLLDELFEKLVELMENSDAE